MINQNNELLKLYGEVLSRFEFVCARMRFSILHMLYPTYDKKQKNYCEIMTEGLTADSIRKNFLGLIIERYSLKSDLYKSAHKISKLFEELIQLRNSFAHGTAFIGEHDFMEVENVRKGVLVLKHTKIRSQGLDLNHQVFDIKRLNVLTKALSDIEYAVKSLTMVIKYYDKLNENAKQKVYELIQKNLQV